MKYKSYKIKTIKRLVKVATSKNIKCLKADICLFLDKMVEFKSLKTEYGRKVLKLNEEKFQWIDDNKPKIKSRIVKE